MLDAHQRPGAGSPRSRSTRSSLAAFFACVACAALYLAIQAAPAAATQCPSEQSLLPADVTIKSFLPFQCAQMEHSGRIVVHPADTKIWSKTISTGYEVKTHCEHPNDSDIAISHAFAGASYTASGHNWGTGDHSFGAGVLFTTYPDAVYKSGFKGGCSNDNAAAKEGRITNSIVKRTDYAKLKSGYATGTESVQQTITAEVSPTSAPGDCAVQKNPDGSPYIDPGTERPVPLPGHGCVLLYLDNTKPDPQAGDTPVASGSLSNGAASIKWTPDVTGKHKLTVLYIGDTVACPSDKGTCGWSPAEAKTYDTCIDPSPACATSATVGGPVAARVARCCSSAGTSAWARSAGIASTPAGTVCGSPSAAPAVTGSCFARRVGVGSARHRLSERARSTAPTPRRDPVRLAVRCLGGRLALRRTATARPGSPPAGPACNPPYSLAPSSRRSWRDGTWRRRGGRRAI